MAVSKCGRGGYLVCCALGWLASAAAIPSNAAIQYDVTTLSGGIAAYGVDHGHVVGVGNALVGATVWMNPGTPRALGGNVAYGISGSQIVGDGQAAGKPAGTIHAMLWPQGIDLDPGSTFGSAAVATDGTFQGGAVDGTAGIWSGTPGSFVNLSPSGWGGVVRSIANGVQVGYGSLNGDMQALLWKGSASSMVNLTPTSVGSVAEALGVSHGQVVGCVIPENSLQTHAALWTGQTAASFIDLDLGASSSRLLATNGTQQVGYYTLQPIMFGVNPQDFHPAVWNGTAPHAEDLPLPAGYAIGQATAIDSDGNIVGWGSTQAGAPPTAALLWTPHRLPGDANFDGKVDFSDLVTVARNYGKAGSELGWVDGDFMDEGRVGFDDLLMVARNYRAGAPTASQLAQLDPAFRANVERAFAEAPEPSALPMLSMALALLRRPRSDRR